MAVSNVSTIDSEVWQLITTNSPSSVTTSSFTGISGYKKLMLTYQVQQAGNDRLYIQFNGDTTARNYGQTGGLYGTQNNMRSDIKWYIAMQNDTDTAGYIVIADADKTTPKWIERAGGYGTGYNNGVYLGTSAISSILVSNDTPYAFTGTIKLYGIAS